MRREGDSLPLNPSLGITPSEACHPLRPLRTRGRASSGKQNRKEPHPEVPGCPSSRDLGNGGGPPPKKTQRNPELRASLLPSLCAVVHSSSTLEPALSLHINQRNDSWGQMASGLVGLRGRLSLGLQKCLRPPPASNKSSSSISTPGDPQPDLTLEQTGML